MHELTEDFGGILEVAVEDHDGVARPRATQSSEGGLELPDILGEVDDLRRSGDARGDLPCTVGAAVIDEEHAPWGLHAARRHAGPSSSRIADSLYSGDDGDARRRHEGTLTSRPRPQRRGRASCTSACVVNRQVIRPQSASRATRDCQGSDGLVKGVEVPSGAHAMSREDCGGCFATGRHTRRDFGGWSRRPWARVGCRSLVPAALSKVSP